MGEEPVCGYVHDLAVGGFLEPVLAALYDMQLCVGEDLGSALRVGEGYVIAGVAMEQEGNDVPKIF